MSDSEYSVIKGDVIKSFDCNSKTPSKGKHYLLTSYNNIDVTESAPCDANGTGGQGGIHFATKFCNNFAPIVVYSQ